MGSPAPILVFVLQGLTRFDLLGDFGRFNWLGNFYIVFLYNAAFAGLTTLCLVKTFTAAVRAELIRAFGKREWRVQAGGGDREVEPSETVVIPAEKVAFFSALFVTSLIYPFCGLFNLSQRTGPMLYF